MEVIAYTGCLSKDAAPLNVEMILQDMYALAREDGQLGSSCRRVRLLRG
jgi:hypothetical protein